MQVDKNCNATGTTQNNQQIVALGVNAKHGGEVDSKPKELQQKQQDHIKQKQPQSAQQQQQPSSEIQHSGVTSAAAAAAAAAHPIQPQTAITADASATANPNQSQSAPMFDQQQHNVINRMITTIVQQNNGSAKVQKMAGESMIPTFRSGNTDSPPQKNISGKVANACQHATYHKCRQQNNTTSFTNNAPKTDAKNVVNTESIPNDCKNPVKRHSAPQVEVSHLLISTYYYVTLASRNKI